MNIKKLKINLIVIMVALFAAVYNIPVYADEIEVNNVEEYADVINGVVVEVENNEEEVLQQDSQEEVEACLGEPIEVVEEDNNEQEIVEEQNC